MVSCTGLRNLFLFQKQDDQCKGSGINCISYNIPFYEKGSILNKLISKPVRKSFCSLPFKIKSLAVPSGSTRSAFSSKTDLGVCLRADSPGRNYRTGWNYFKNMHLLQYNTIKGKSIAAYALE